MSPIGGVGLCHRVCSSEEEDFGVFEDVISREFFVMWSLLALGLASCLLQQRFHGLSLF